ncbi:MAG: hypothetical protein QOG54_2655 [Actinomycetota bacterium]|jgi:hypothetical protein|nr:hypothetical protein [Actinomycetota bacterium]
MSIETTLTLLIAAGILAVAAVLKLTFYSVVWVVTKVAGREMQSWGTRRGAVAALPRVPLSSRAGRAIQAARLVVVLVVATIATWVVKGAIALSDLFAAFGAWLEPRLTGAYRWAKPWVIAGGTRGVSASRSGLRRIGSWWIYEDGERQSRAAYIQVRRDRL